MASCGAALRYFEEFLRGLGVPALLAGLDSHLAVLASLQIVALGPVQADLRGNIAKIRRGYEKMYPEPAAAGSAEGERGVHDGGGSTDASAGTVTIEQLKRAEAAHYVEGAAAGPGAAGGRPALFSFGPRSKQEPGIPDDSASVGLKWACTSLEFTLRLMQALVPEDVMARAASAGGAREAAGGEQSPGTEGGMGCENAAVPPALTKQQLLDRIEHIDLVSAAQAVYDRTLRKLHPMPVQIGFSLGLKTFPRARDFVGRLDFKDADELGRYIRLGLEVVESVRCGC